MAKAKGMAAFDGWSNAFKGIGIRGRDASVSTEYRMTQRLDEATLRSMWSGDGIATKIVELPVKEMTRRGFTITNDTDNKMNKFLDQTRMHEAIRDLLRWSRLFGGAVAVIGANDGQSQIWRPLNEKSIQSLDFLRVYDRYRVTWSSADLYQDPAHPKYGTPEKYHISPIYGRPFTIHETRVIVLDGLSVPDMTRIENLGWGDSVIQRCFEQCKQLAMSMASTGIILDDFIQAVFSIKGLGRMVAAGNYQQILDRMTIMSMGKSVLNGIALDSEGETYEKHASSVAGIADLLDRMMNMVSATSSPSVPVTLLFGRSAAGMNATGEGDRINWYDDCAGEQQDTLKPVYQRLLPLIMLAKRGPFGGKIIADWEINFKQLYQPTEKEIIELRYKHAQTLKIFTDISVLHEDEVRESVFGSGSYSYDIKLLPKYNEPGSRPRKAVTPDPTTEPGDEDPKKKKKPGDPPEPGTGAQ